MEPRPSVCWCNIRRTWFFRLRLMWLAPWLRCLRCKRWCCQSTSSYPPACTTDRSHVIFHLQKSERGMFGRVALTLTIQLPTNLLAQLAGGAASAGAIAIHMEANNKPTLK